MVHQMAMMTASPLGTRMAFQWGRKKGSWLVQQWENAMAQTLDTHLGDGMVSQSARWMVECSVYRKALSLVLRLEYYWEVPMGKQTAYLTVHT